MTRVEAFEWLEQGNKLYFSDDPLVANSRLLVEGLYEKGAEVVEAVAYPRATETSTLAITLSNDYDSMLATMFEVGILTPRGPIVLEQRNMVLVTWGRDRTRLSSNTQYISIVKRGSLYRIDSVFYPKSSTTYSNGLVVDFGGTLQSKVINQLKETGALVDPIVSDPDKPKRAFGLYLILPESYNRALECMVIVALLGLDCSSWLTLEQGQCAKVRAYALDSLLA